MEVAGVMHFFSRFTGEGGRRPDEGQNVGRIGLSPECPHLPVGIFSRKREKSFFDAFNRRLHADDVFKIKYLTRFGASH